MERGIEELLSDVSEIESLLAKGQPRQYASQICVLAELVADSASDPAVNRLATALKQRASRLLRDTPRGNGEEVERMKDAAFRLRTSLLALKRGGSPIE
jgi:hypothetical protein